MEEPKKFTTVYFSEGIVGYEGFSMKALLISFELLKSKNNLDITLAECEVEISNEVENNTYGEEVSYIEYNLFYALKVENKNYDLEMVEYNKFLQKEKDRNKQLEEDYRIALIREAVSETARAEYKKENRARRIKAYNEKMLNLQNNK